MYRDRESLEIVRGKCGVRASATPNSLAAIEVPFRRRFLPPDFTFARMHSTCTRVIVNTCLYIYDAGCGHGARGITLRVRNKAIGHVCVVASFRPRAIGICIDGIGRSTGAQFMLYCQYNRGTCILTHAQQQISKKVE